MQDLSLLSREELDNYHTLCEVCLGPFEISESMPGAAHVWKEELRKVEIEIFERSLFAQAADEN